MGIERYRPYIPDWQQFCQVATTPEPTTIRIPSTRVDPSTLLTRLTRQGFRLEPLEFPPHFYRVVEAPFPIAKTLEHWLGLFYIQQAVTGCVAYALDLRPGMHVLDLCAAPGGKTTHMSDRLENTGAVVAADINEHRLRALLSNTFRMGCLNTLVVRMDGRNVPEGVQFDAVLVDAPCSAEGNLRDSPRVLRESPPSFRAYVTRVQENLLRSAIRLTRPGGSILYVTCTFAPEENEAILDRVLRDSPVTVETIDLPIPHASGWSAFEGQAFHPAVAGAWRIYPHHLNSGGLFMARLRKGGKADDVESCPSVPLAYSPEQTEEAARRLKHAWAYLEEAFGIERSLLESVRWLYWNGNFWIHRCACWPIGVWKPRKDWRWLACGLRALRPWKGGWKPTSYFLQWLQNAVQLRRIVLGRTEWLRLLQGQTLRVSGISDGFVAVALENEVLGCGLVKQGRLTHQIPLERARMLEEVLSLQT